MTERRERDSYVVDNIFPSGYISFLQPALLSYVAATAGYVPPNAQSQFVYLELGCGTGTTLEVLAAANPESRFIGIDFNTLHIAIARQAAIESGLENVTYIESSFENLPIAELPECDYVAIHGAYSWLPPSAETAVHEIVDRKLRKGGIFFVDYVCAPTAVPVSPLWYLLREITKLHIGSSEERVAYGMEVLRLFGDMDHGYLAQNPSAKRVLKKNIRRVDANDPNVLRHLAHHALAEYCNERFFIEIRDTMRRFNLEFAGNCITWRNSLEYSLPPKFREFCAGHGDAGIGELIKDFLINRNQRQDIFIKDVDRDPDSAIEYLRKNVFLFSMRPSAGILKLWDNDSEAATLDIRADPAVKPVLEALDQGLTSFAEIEAHCLRLELATDDVIRAFNVLVGRQNILLCCKAPGNRDSDYRMPDQFNLFAEARRNRANRTNLIVASPVVGAGLTLGPGHAQAFLAFVGGRIAGGPTDPDSGLPEPNVRQDFQRRMLPRLHRLGVFG